jgi:hypothetical protein
MPYLLARLLCVLLTVLAQTSSAASATDKLTIHVSGDSFKGNAKFQVTVDGVKVGRLRTAYAGWHDVVLTGHFAQAHNIGITFVNDLQQPGVGDRNLWIDYIELNGHRYEAEAAVSNTGWSGPPPAGGAVVLAWNGTLTFAIDAAPPAPAPAPVPTLTRFDGTVKTSYAGQVIEGLDIYSGTTGIIVANASVTIRNVRIHHGAGDGILAQNATNLRIENVEILETNVPAGQAGAASADQNNIELVNSPNAVIHNVSLHDGSSGIYLVFSPGAQISHVDGYNFHGPFPRGQLVQFNGSPNGSLTDFYVRNDPNASHPEDNISIYNSANVRVANGVIDGNNSVNGIGVQAEGSSGGSTVTHVDAIHMGNGGFGSYANDVHFIDVHTFDSFNVDQGRGAPSSKGLQFVISNGTSGVTFQGSTYTNPGNRANIAWDVSHAALFDVRDAPTAAPMSHAPYVNEWRW